jgi:arylsulfatase A-like enzyme
VDLPPTLLALVDLPPHPSFQGVSLIPSRPDKPLFLVSQALVNQYGIVRGEWKLIFDSNYGSYKLFNLREDPEERVDLSRTDRGILRDLATQLHGWRKSQLTYYSDPEEQRSRYPPRSF